METLFSKSAGKQVEWRGNSYKPSKIIPKNFIDLFVYRGDIYEEGYALAVPTNIKTLLAGNAVEWARIEFKETWDAEASLKTICAFAND